MDQDIENAQSRTRGKLEDEYQIYVDQAKSMGWEVKTFDDWLNS